MDRPQYEVADVFGLHAASFEEAFGSSLSRQQRKVMRAIIQCRTAALGGHVEACGNCGCVRISYNSCRNRHCPKCQSLARARWLEARKAELLPVEYFHVVFTVPDTVAALALQNRRVLYGTLFRTAADALLRIAADPQHLGAEIGFLAVLHTWGSNLLHHPHIHCVVPGGGLSFDGRRWVRARKGFFLPVRVLSRLFRGLFLAALQEAFDAGHLDFFGDLAPLASPTVFSTWLKAHWKTDWVVYSKRPFGGPEQVLEYLGRYTHRVAISNSRILNVTDDAVTFRWKDYRGHNPHATMTLKPHEFMRRFLLHALPRGFVRLRHFGFLANRHRHDKLARCRELLHAPPPPQPQDGAAPMDWKQRYELLTGRPIDLCPSCQQGHMRIILILDPILHPHPPPRMDSS